jgi:hypothetical protein
MRKYRINAVDRLYSCRANVTSQPTSALAFWHVGFILTEPSSFDIVVAENK